MRDHLRSSGSGYLVAGLATAAAFGVRLLLDPLLGDHLPYLTFFAAVVAAAWHGGWWPGLLATLASLLLAWFFFVPARLSFSVADGPHLVGLAMYFLVSLAIAASAGATREAQRRSRRAEQAVRREQEWFRTTLASIGDAVIATDAQGRVSFINDVAQALTGWTKEDATAKPLETVFQIINEQTHRPVKNPVEEVLKLGRVVGMANHTVLIARDGTERPIDDSAAPIRDEEGRPIGVVLVFHDVTARRQAEKALRASEAEARRLLELNRAIMANMGEGLYAVDTRGLVTYLNPAAERLFGWAGGELLGRKMHEMTHYMHPDGRPFPIEECAGFQVLHKGVVLEDYEDTFIRKDGSFLPVSYSSSPLCSDGAVVGLVVVFRDVTERKRAEEALRDNDRRKDEFLAMLAHELRNPLAPIRNAVQVLRLVGPQEGASQHAREMIDRQVSHLVRLVDDLLDVSRITRGKITLQKEPVDLAAVAAAAVESSRPLIDARRHELQVSVPPQPVRVEGDLTRLAQIVLNLLNNSAKYTPEGGHIWLTVGRQDAWAVLRVRDDGVGIAPDLLPKVFDMFTQAERTLDRSQGGLGIGLTLVSKLVEMHGGTVEAFSAGLGQGSEFVVRLPLLPATPEPGRAGEQDRPEGAEQASAVRRVLVVDDNVDAADSLATLLKLNGNEVRTAYDGQTALKLSDEYRPDVVLLDIGLPGMDGYEVARRLRRRPGFDRTALVALSGYGSAGDRRRSEECGFYAHLTKPVSPAELEKLLAGLTGPSV